MSALGSRGSRSAVSARRRRLTRLRTTALPTAFDTTTPTLGPSSFARACTTRVLRPARAPDRTAAVNSVAERSRTADGNTLRRTAQSGPCGDAPPGSLGPRESACAAGNHGSWPGAGCSAGTYAWSRVTPCRKHTGRLLPALTIHAVGCARGQARVTRNGASTVRARPPPGQTRPVRGWFPQHSPAEFSTSTLA